MKKTISCILCVLLVAVMLACGQNHHAVNPTGDAAAESAEAVPAYEPKIGEGDDIVIVYTNDIHSYMANDMESNLRLSQVAQMVKDMKAEGRKVVLVDAGDEIQGNSYGTIDHGESVVEIMSAAGYSVAVPGNHDYDYGMEQLFMLADEAGYEFISCNFKSADMDGQPFEGYKILDVGNKKVAFVGITTPETLTSSTPAYFQDDEGNLIYWFDGMKSPDDLYQAVQAAIDEVKGQVDYVIALGHVGVGIDEKKAGISSEDVIAHTSGLDAFIDGHSHTVMEAESVKDMDGNEVCLTQTGSYLSFVGIMDIANTGEITTQMVNAYESQDPSVAELEQKLVDMVDAVYGQKVASLETDLTVMNPENDKQRLIRAQEMNIGDFTADSVYWYFNENRQIPCDLALSNGGGIRATMEAGDITGNDVKNVQPFGNMICLINATGQQILDALEMGVTVIGEWDDEWDSPAENGGFLQVAGMKYTIDSGIPSSVKTDENGMFQSVDGDYRVKDVEIYNRETGAYEPLDLKKTYTVAGVNYILRNSGNGLSMFKDCDMVVDYAGMDYDVMLDYMNSFPKSGEYPLINTAGSPLNSYAGYQLDYDNPYGAGRITIE